MANDGFKVDLIGLYEAGSSIEIQDLKWNAGGGVQHWAPREELATLIGAEVPGLTNIEDGQISYELEVRSEDSVVVENKTLKPDDFVLVLDPPRVGEAEQVAEHLDIILLNEKGMRNFDLLRAEADPEICPAVQYETGGGAGVPYETHRLIQVCRQRRDGETVVSRGSGTLYVPMNLVGILRDGMDTALYLTVPSLIDTFPRRFKRLPPNRY